MLSTVNNTEDDISLIDLYKLLWRKKIIILLSAFSFSLIGFFYIKSVEDIYQSNTLLAPSTNADSAPSMGMLSGVASIAGINLPTDSSTNNTLISLERLQSLDFFKMVVEKHDLYYELEAVKAWDKQKNVLIIDQDFYDLKENKWIYEDEFAIDGKPSIQEAHSNFLKDFSINYDVKTGFVRLSMKHYSPNVAKKILDIFVDEINNTVREEDISLAQQMISYLTNENLKTTNVDLKLGINSLIQNQIKKIAIANSTPQYVLKTISPPYSPERRYSPNRILIVLITFMIGLMVASMYFILQKIYLNELNSD